MPISLTGQTPSASYNTLLVTDGVRVYNGVGTQLTSIVITASMALSSSYAPGGGTSLATGSTYPITASQAVSASYLSGSQAILPIVTDAYYDLLLVTGSGTVNKRVSMGSNGFLRYNPSISAFAGQLNLGGNLNFVSNTVIESEYQKILVSNQAGALNLLLSGSGTQVIISSGGNITIPTAARFVGTASFATTASYALNAVAGGLATGSTYPITASQAITASYWNSSSVNSWTTNNFQFKIATGSILPVTSSQSITASYALNGGSGGGLATGSTYPITSSQSESSSWVKVTDIGNPNIDYPVVFNNNGLFTNGGGTSLYAFNPGTGSFKATVFLGNLTGTASFATTASYALNAVAGGLATGSTYPITASQAISASYLSGSLAVFPLSQDNYYDILFVTGSGTVNKRVSLDSSGFLRYDPAISAFSSQLNLGGVFNLISNTATDPAYRNLTLENSAGALSIKLSGSSTPQVSISPLGNITATSITASLKGTSSFAITASYAIVANSANNAGFASDSQFSVSASWASSSISSSYVLSSSYAVSASWAPTGGGVVDGGSYNISTSFASGSLTSSFSLKASGSVTASNFLVNNDIVFTHSSSRKIQAATVGQLNTTGSSLNIIAGDANVGSFASAIRGGSITILAGSASHNGSVGGDGVGGSITLRGGVAASFATDFNGGDINLFGGDGVGSGFRGRIVISGSQVYTNCPITASRFSGTGSYSISASYALNAVAGGLATGSTYPITASQAITASYWDSSSIVNFFETKQNNISTGSTLPVTASQSVTASYLSGSTAIVQNLTATFGAIIGGFDQGVATSSTTQIGNNLTRTNITTNTTQIGNKAGQFATTASGATQIGNESGQNSTVSTNATQFGYQAGQNSATASGATQIGYQAGQNSTNATNAIQMGTFAGQNATTAIQATQIGPYAGAGGTNSNNATHIGYAAGYTTVFSTAATQIGATAGYNCKTGSGVVQIGSEAGYASTNAAGAVQIGNYAGRNVPAAANAVQIGYAAGANVTTGTSAVQIGSSAGNGTVNAFQAVQIGLEAGTAVSNASNAIQIGSYAGRNAITASGAVQIGFSAGSSADNSTNAIHIGNSTGLNAKTGSSTTFIGALADTTDANLDVGKSIAIGYNAKVGGPNTAVIGGTGADAVKVTIGGTTAVNTLDVVGNISCSVITASLFYGTASYALRSEYLQLIRPDVFSLSASIYTASILSPLYQHGLFDSASNSSSNYVEYYLTVPYNLNPAKDLRGQIKYQLIGTDTGSYVHKLSMASIADGNFLSITPTNEITFTTPTTGSVGTVKSTGWSTLTNWSSSLVAGQLWKIRLARDGSDGSVSQSADLSVNIEYQAL